LDGLDQNLKPGFALSLSFDGISLLHRAAGGWRLVGEVALDVADLPAELDALRRKAERLEPGQLVCKLIIPNDQIRYLTVATGEQDREERELLVLKSLEGATPYDVSDLAYDISSDGEMTHAAAVARETLAEAESFAAEHGFNPTSFVAVPGENAYLGEPFFGNASALQGVDVVPDGIAVVNIGPAIYPDPEPEPDPPSEAPEDGPTDGDQDSPMAGPDQLAPDQPADPDPKPFVGFTSRRGKRSETKPAAPDKPAPAVASPVAPPPVERSLAPQVNAPDAPLFAAPGEPDETGAAPAPVIPDPTIPPAAPRAIAAPTEPTGFQSRRQPPAQSGAKAKADTPPKAQPITEETDETARMTLFGARDQVKVGGKPKFLGPVLLSALVLFMLVVAAWAALFSDYRLTDLLRSSPTETAPAPESETEPAAESDSTETPDTGTRPAVSAPAGSEDETVVPPLISSLPAPVRVPLPEAEAGAEAEPELADTPEAEAVPQLSDTDIAVLDALSDPGNDGAEVAPADDPDPLPAEAPLPADENARYAATGIWPTAPVQSETPSVIGLDDLHLGSIDRTDLSQDAVALLPAESFRTDLIPGSQAAPAGPGQKFDLDNRGLVKPTPEGTLSPDGVLVYLGRPAVVPPAAPTRFETQPETDAQQLRLAGFRPRLRPEDLDEQIERTQLGGLSRAELGRVRPALRPERVEARALAALEAEAAAEQQAEAETTPEETTTTAANAPGDISSATRLAVARAVVPKARPSNMAEIVRRAESSGASTVAAIAPVTVKPSIPSSASVARQATFENALNLRRVNLIGVYGTPSDRRALVRLPSGRYRKVQVGDKVDGGKVLAIGDNTLRYEKRGRSLTLKIPNG
jgi:hypothetical protein